MSHIFDHKQFKKLDSPARRESMPPELVCEQLQLNSQMVVADVGCGVGYFAFPFSEIVEKVHAIDISSIMIDELNRRISTQTNLIPHLGDFNESLDADSLDLFFTATVAHELEDILDFSKKAIHKLKKGGRIAFLDFKKIESSFGPPYEKRIAAKELITLFETLGLSKVTEYSIKDNFYLVIGQK